MASYYKVDMDALKRTDPDMYQNVLSVLKYPHVRGTGEQLIDVDAYSDSTRAKIIRWLHEQKAQTQPVLVVAEPAPPPPQIDFNEVVKGQRAQADTSAAKARLNWWAETQGLEDSQSNADAIVAHIHEALGGYFDARNIDSTVAYLGPNGTNVLRWTTPQVAPAAPETTERLADWQLPINADERQMRKSSTKALLDLNQRRRKLTNQQYVRKSGSFGSKFI